MPITEIEKHGETPDCRRTFLCDETADVDNLPTQSTQTDEYPEGVGTGSMALDAETGNTIVLKSTGEWKQI